MGRSACELHSTPLQPGWAKCDFYDKRVFANINLFFPRPKCWDDVFSPQIVPLPPLFISLLSVLSNSFKGNRNYIENIVKNRSNFCISFKFCTKKLYPTLFLPTPWGAQICFYLALSNIELKLKYASTFERKSWKCFIKRKIPIWVAVNSLGLSECQGMSQEFARSFMYIWVRLPWCLCEILLRFFLDFAWMLPDIHLRFWSNWPKFWCRFHHPF